MQQCVSHKQPPEVFLKRDVLKNFEIFKGKKPVLECHFKKVADLKAATLLKRHSNTGALL